MLNKQKENTDREFALVRFNSTIKTVINFKYDLRESLQEIIYRIDNWFSERSGWIIEEKVDNLSIFRITVHYQEVHKLNCLIN